MKRLSILFSIALTLGLFVYMNITNVSADSEYGTLKVTFIRNNISDENVYFYIWKTGTPTSDHVVSKNGIFHTSEVKIYAGSEDNIGFIPTIEKIDADGNPSADWDNKLSYDGNDLSFNVSDIKGSGVKHAYVYENAKDNEVVYSSTNTANYMMFVTYYSASYESNLGVHSWGMTPEHTSSDWGTPLEVFSTIGRAPDNSEIKGALLESPDNSGNGVIVYAGSDSTKKHSENIEFEEDVIAGTPQFVGVTNGAVYNEESSEQYTEDAFKLKFIDFGVASNGAYVGTYAVNSNTMLVSLSSAIEVPTVKTEATDNTDEVLYTKEERVALLKNQFTIYVTNSVTSVITISSIDFDVNSETAKDFVFTLNSEFDQSKSYTITFDNGIKQASLEIDIDNEAPVITLLRGQDVIDVEWGKPFDMKNFPQYEATDSRDGDVTAKVYVPSGEGLLDTSIEGEYKVVLRVSDAWGNTTDKVITFRVVK